MEADKRLELVARHRLLLRYGTCVVHKEVWHGVRSNEIDGKVFASNEKAQFLAKKMNLIVATHYFCKDILSIDQRDDDATVAVIQHIPTIFRLAKRTIVVRESTGCRDCCALAIRPYNDRLVEDGPKYETFSIHYLEAHSFQPGYKVMEGIFTML